MSSVELSPDTIAGVISDRATRTPNAIALGAPQRAPLTYGQLAAEVKRITATLNAHGIRRNDRVALVLPNGPEMAVAFLGVAAGATAAPLNPEYRREEFDFYLSDLGARALIVSREMDSPARAAARAREIKLVEIAPLAEQAAGLLQFMTPPESTPGEPEFAEPGDVALVLHTSGTTSRPKIVPLTGANICASARHIRATLRLGPEDRCLNVMPLFHIHGLMAALLASLTAGGSVICTPGFYAPRFFGWMDDMAPTWYTAVPTMHQAILARAPANADVIARHPLRFIRSSSAALAPPVMAEMERVFSAPVIEAYGMTEAAHQMASNPLPPQVHKPGSVGPAAGPEIAIMDQAGSLLDAGARGEIVIRGADVTAGYENNPTANAAAFTNGWFRTGDEGYLDADGYVFITGRLKELINRGGEKIAPREIDEVLLNHPAVAQAVTFAMPDTRLGEEVAAAVVLRENAAATERELRDYAAQHLASFKVPRRILLLQDIPKGPTGKLQRIGLADKLGLKESAPAPRPEFVAARSPLEAQVAGIWQTVLGVEHIGVHDNFSESGGDSIMAAQVLARVRAELELELPFLSLFEDAATIATMSELIEQMRREERGQVIHRMPTRASDTFRDTPRDDEGQLLSYGQQRLWFLDQFEPNSSIYNMHKFIRLKGALDVDALESSLNEIVRRHQVLRATFRMAGNEPRQFITPYQSFALPIVDLRHLPAPERADAKEQLALKVAVQPYDLAQGPLFRTLLAQLADDEYALLLAMHHIVSDGWSLGVLANELSALYDAYVAGKPSPLPELPMQYADYMRRQRGRLQGESLKRQLDYWLKQLAGAPPVLELPLDRPRPRIRTNHGAIQELTLDKPLIESLTQLGRREHVTLFMVLLAAFQTLLYRYSGQEDVIVGIPIAGRRDVDSEGLIGFFLNTLVIRTDLGHDPTARQLLARVREVALGAYSHQDVPFEQVVTELRPDRNLGWNPVFQVMMQFETLSKEHVEFKGIEITESQLDLGISRFDLALTLSDKPQGVLARLQYSTDLFEPATITRLLAHFKAVLEGIVRNPDSPVSRLPMLTQAERHQQLVEWNATATPIPDNNKCIHQLFEEQVARTPDALALVASGEQLTYRELNHRANQFANYLLKFGVTPDTLVGILLERSVEQIVALWGILKAGGAYLPLDPAYPMKRLAFMLEDAHAPLLVTRGPLPADLDGMAQVIDVARDAGEIARASIENPASPVRPENLVYVIYTSGSTGQPKGVQIEHRGLCNSALAQQRTFGLKTGARMLQFASLNFDASIFEIVMALTAGATLYLTPREAQSSGSALYQFLQEQSIEAAILTPSTLAALPDGPLPELQNLMLGGEALPPELVTRWANGRRMFNLYGPTENTIWATVAECSPHTKLSIGRPIANVQTYVLDSHLEPEPIGVAGELYIAGAGLARGYLNRADLTAERFIPDPFSDEPNARLYKTGDMARYLPDGSIEYLGRLDRQVKLRGFRIELGEIESVLRQHATVKDVIVTIREDVGKQAAARLVAYVVPRPGAQANTAELRAHAKTMLPDHMVPSAFVMLESLPKTPGDKVDVNALPAPAVGYPQSQQTYLPAATELERAIAQLWEETLGLERVGREDDFFELGGDSILAAILTNQLQDRLQEYVSVVLIFEAPTIAALAAALEKQYPSTIGRLAASGDARAGARGWRAKLQTSNALVTPPRNGEPMPEEISQLSEDEIDALLSALLDESELER